MARLSEPPAASSSQSGTKRSISLKNGFLASATKPSGSQSPHPNKRLKSLATTAGSPSPADEPPRSQSPPSQRPSSSLAAPLSSPSLPKPFGDTFADEMDMGEIRASGAPGDSVIAAMSAQPDDDSTPANTAPTAFMGPSIDVAQMSTPTPEPVVPKVTGVVSSVKQSVSNVFSGFGASRNGTATANAFTTFEQTIASRKRSREPESEETPASSEKEEADAEAGNATAEVNDTTIQLGNQFEADAAADEERAKSPVKEAVEVAAPTASPTDGGEINVTTTPENADTIEAESTETAEPAAAATTSAVEDEDEDMADDPTNDLFVIEEIYGHRRDPKDKTLFQMHVRWKHDTPSWEPESNIQEDAEDLLFAYWDSVKGGRRAHMADKGLWHALKVEKHRQKAHGAVEVQVAWVGSRDRSWEPEDQVQQYARELLEDYWVAKGGREKHVRAIAVPTKRGRGRPRKDAASEAPSTEAEKDEEPVKAIKAPAKAVKEPVKAVKAPVKANSRAARKKAPVVEEAPEPAAEPAAEESKAAEAAPADEEEPPRKRGRGRPRKSVP
ncbi:putative chromo domain-containing protein [Colletotrichum sojae]|uniref:Putative chromo domain-containing protein n=1 Tax=Colletotrichum sojae TaxID=2175907 RepID=A0A8H6JE81_9PEZI|nr:putative chromo domain-containing protein [Colletotrichum sojae]